MSDGVGGSKGRQCGHCQKVSIRDTHRHVCVIKISASIGRRVRQALLAALLHRQRSSDSPRSKQQQSQSWM